MSLGTGSRIENQSAGGYTILRNDYKLPPTAHLLRLLIQQSNCFVVVERGAAGMNAMTREHAADADRQPLRRAVATSEGSYSNTAQGKVISAAFMDALNQMVVAQRSYKAPAATKSTTNKKK